MPSTITTKEKDKNCGKPQGISKEYNNDSNQEKNVDDDDDDDDDNDDDDDDDDDVDDESDEEDMEPAATVVQNFTKRKAADPSEVGDLFPPAKKQTASSVTTTSTVLTGINDFCNEKTVYIEGLPYEVTEDDIATFFESCGCIESVRLPRWHDSNKLRGYGHVQFKNATAAKKAIELDGKNHIVGLLQSYLLFSHEFTIYP